MLIKILIAVAVIAVALVIFIATRPGELRVARSATIFAPVAEVFAQVNDFHRWEAWSPYEKLDPAMKRTFAGEAAGRGAIYSWNGNNQVGEGTSTIVESRANELIRINLQFVRPFACNNMAEFSFEPQGEGTTVTWTLHGRNSFMGKAVGLVMNMDKMVGGQFEQGLAQLKTVAEAESLARAPAAVQSSAMPVSAAH